MYFKDSWKTRMSLLQWAEVMGNLGELHGFLMLSEMLLTKQETTHPSYKGHVHLPLNITPSSYLQGS